MLINQIEQIMCKRENITEIIKIIASDLNFRKLFKNNSELYASWLHSAKRYIGGETLEESGGLVNSLSAYDYITSFRIAT